MSGGFGGGQVADVRLLRDGGGLEHLHGRGPGRCRGAARGPAARRLPPGRAGDRGRPALAALPGRAHRRAGAGGRTRADHAAARRGRRVRPGVAADAGIRGRWSGPDRAGRTRLAAGLPHQLRRRPVRDDLPADPRAIRAVGHGSGGAQLQAGSHTFPQVRREDRGDQGELDSCREQLGARHDASGAAGAALGLGRPGPDRAPGQARRQAGHQHAQTARGGQRRERHPAAVIGGTFGAPAAESPRDRRRSRPATAARRSRAERAGEGGAVGGAGGRGSDPAIGLDQAGQARGGSRRGRGRGSARAR